MRNIPILFFIFLVFGASAQTTFTPTEQFSIEGKIQHAITFTIASLDTFKTKSLPDVIITNHLGVKKNTLTQLKGILLKDILSGVSLEAENPKEFSAFYFLFVAIDNYKVIFSWNEIFNTETGNNLYLITEENGKKMKDLDGRISMICLTDATTGRRNLKNLQKIIVERAN